MSTIPRIPAPDTLAELQNRIREWFHNNGRDLPWRTALPSSGSCSPWGIMVSEFMLQQTPVVRVLPQWQQWLTRWPTPAALAAESSGEAVRAWGRLGYPRRALRLHAAAQAIVADHDGEVPATREELASLPGIGSYTSAAIAAFAFGQRENVVDTNIRRVHARLISGKALPAAALNRAEEKLSEALLPQDAADSVSWNAAVMELGALVCTARAPKCESCPVRDACAWLAAGQPAPDYIPKGQPWHGTDRQVRGAIMAVLRATEQGVPIELFLGATDLIWADAPEQSSTSVLGLLDAFHGLGAGKEQVRRALSTLQSDGLAHEKDGTLSLNA